MTPSRKHMAGIANPWGSSMEVSVLVRALLAWGDKQGFSSGVSTVLHPQKKYSTKTPPHPLTNIPFFFSIEWSWPNLRYRPKHGSYFCLRLQLTLFVAKVAARPLKHLWTPAPLRNSHACPHQQILSQLPGEELCCGAPEALAKCTGDSRSCGTRSGFSFLCVPAWRVSLVVETYAKGCPESRLRQNRKFSFAVLLPIVNHTFFNHLSQKDLPC